MEVKLIAKRTFGCVSEGTVVDHDVQTVVDKGTYYSLVTHTNSEIRFDKKNWEIIITKDINIEDAVNNPIRHSRCFIYSNGRHYFYTDEYENFEKIHIICDIDEDYLINMADMFLLEQGNDI